MSLDDFLPALSSIKKRRKRVVGFMLRLLSLLIQRVKYCFISLLSTLMEWIKRKGESGGPFPLMDLKNEAITLHGKCNPSFNAKKDKIC
jgi:hypothetical protein